jgi:hypothetical protein
LFAVGALLQRRRLTECDLVIGGVVRVHDPTSDADPEKRQHHDGDQHGARERIGISTAARGYFGMRGTTR